MTLMTQASQDILLRMIHTTLCKSVASQEILPRMTRMTDLMQVKCFLMKFCFAWFTGRSLCKLVASQKNLLRMTRMIRFMPVSCPQEILLRMTRTTQHMQVSCLFKKSAWHVSNVGRYPSFAYWKPCAMKCCKDCLITYGELHHIYA